MKDGSEVEEERVHSITLLFLYVYSSILRLEKLHILKKRIKLN